MSGPWFARTCRAFSWGNPSNPAGWRRKRAKCGRRFSILGLLSVIFIVCPQFLDPLQGSIMLLKRICPRLMKAKNQIPGSMMQVALGRYFGSSSPGGAGSSRLGLLIREPLMVENKGSLARDLLAVERTFLAWARTGLGFVGAGTALVAAYHDKNAKNEDTGTILANPLIWTASGLLLLNGSAILSFATHRYMITSTAIQRQNQFPISTQSVLGMVTGTSISTLASLYLIYCAEVNKVKAETK